MGIGYTIGLGPSSVGGQGSVNNTLPLPPLVRVGAQIGEGTNNIAEYHALISGLRHAIRLGLWQGHVQSDSMLVVMQIGGQWKVRDAHLRRLHGEAKALTTLIDIGTFSHIRREDNTEADKLSREMVFEEPALPPTDIVKGHSRALHSWQAAFVRHHWLAGIRNSYFLGRVFDVAPSQIEAIGNGTAYKDASFADIPVYGPSPAPILT
jgi:ribonuclease HI